MKPHSYGMVLLGLFIILTNFVVVLFSSSFYEHEFEKLGVYEQISKERVDSEVKIIRNYFLGAEETLYTAMLNPNERIHMLEVRLLIRRVLFLWVSIGVLLLLILLLHPNIRLIALGGSVIAGFLLVLLGVFLLTFSSSFVQFHYLFFQDTSWQLVPGRDVLLTLFPEQFFKDFLVRVVVQSLLTAGILFVAAFGFQKFKSKFLFRHA